MIVFPAIDLKDGACVRLRQGEMDQATVFNDNPAAQARAFAEAGFGEPALFTAAPAAGARSLSPDIRGN